MLELSSFKGRDPLWGAGLCRHHLGILVSITTDWFICQLGMDSPLEGKLPFFIEKGEVGVSSSFPDLLPRGSWKRLDQDTVSMQWDIKLIFSLLLVSLGGRVWVQSL